MFNLPLLYQIDIVLGIVLLAQLILIGLQLHYHKRTLYLLENTLYAIGYVLVALASFINTYLFLVMATCFVVVIILMLVPIWLYRKQPNPTTLFINRFNLLFGYILLTAALSVQPVYPLTAINLIAIDISGLEKFLPGITWPILLSNVYLSYGVLYVLGNLTALFAYWQKKKNWARLLILLPAIPLTLLIAAWIAIGIHFAITKQFYIALTF